VLVAVCATAAIGLTGCGAQEAEVVKGAFEQGIDSANVTATVDFKFGQGSSSTALEGPFKTNGEGKLPSFDFQVTLGGQGLNGLEGRLISSGKNMFVEYKGETYEVGEDVVAELQRNSKSDSGELTAADIQKLMGTMQNWFPQSDTLQDADLDGEPVTRVSGKLDISAALKDLKSLAERGAISGSKELKSLSSADIREVEKMTSDPKFTVDVGRDDGKLRRIVASMKVTDGSETGTINLSVRFKDVDKPVTIDAPTSGKPIEELGEVIGEEFGGGSDATENSEAVQG
jgi:hypothetical protein